MKQTEQVAEIEISYRPAISNKPIIKSSLDAYNVIAQFFPANTIALQEKFFNYYLTMVYPFDLPKLNAHPYEQKISL